MDIWFKRHDKTFIRPRYNIFFERGRWIGFNIQIGHKELRIGYKKKETLSTEEEIR